MKRFAGIVAFLTVALGVGFFAYLITKQKKEENKQSSENNILVETLDEIYYPVNLKEQENNENFSEPDSLESL